MRILNRQEFSDTLSGGFSNDKKPGNHDRLPGSETKLSGNSDASKMSIKAYAVIYSEFSRIHSPFISRSLTVPLYEASETLMESKIASTISSSVAPSSFE